MSFAKPVGGSGGVTLPILESDVTGLVADLAAKASTAALTTTNTNVSTNTSAISSLTTSVAGKLSLTGGTLTGALTVPSITTGNGSWSIDGSGNAVFNAEVDCGSILNSGLFYAKSSFKVWNKAHNAYLFLATRNETGGEVVYDLGNIGSITAASGVISGTLVANGLQLSSNPAITGSSGFTFLNVGTGQQIFLNGGAGSAGTLNMDGGSITNTGDFGTITASTAINGGDVTATGKLAVQKTATTAVAYANINDSFNPEVELSNQINLTLTGNSSIDVWTGTPVDGQGLLFKIIGGGYALTWSATYWNPMIGVTLPSTTSSMYYVTCVFNGVTGQFDILGATGVA